jgi:hypothetical protein
MIRHELIGGHNQLSWPAPPPTAEEYAATHAPDARALGEAHRRLVDTVHAFLDGRASREDLAFALRYGQATVAHHGTWHICCACAGRGIQVGVACGCRQRMEAATK